MNTTDNTIGQHRRPHVSFVMPCFNEEESVEYTIRRLTSAFEKADYRLELIAVDNGSHDRTGEIIRKLAAENGSIVFHRVEKNQGYGYGVLCGFSVCTAPWVGIIPADGQVDAEDVVRLFESVLSTNGKVLGKVRRRFRMDGLLRKIVSVSYNLFVRALWPGIGSIDINGSPKILPREAITAMNLQAEDWFLDPEIILKAHHMGIRILEFNVFARMRGNGLSHVRVWTCFEFFRNILIFRFSKKWTKNIAKFEGQPKVYNLRSDSATTEVSTH